MSQQSYLDLELSTFSSFTITNGTLQTYDVAKHHPAINYIWLSLALTEKFFTYALEFCNQTFRLIEKKII